MTESKFERPVSMLTQEVTIPWFDRSRFAVSDHQMSKLQSKFYFIRDSKKFQVCTAKSPNPRSTPKFPRSWGTSQAVGALNISVRVL